MVVDVGLIGKEPEGLTDFSGRKGESKEVDQNDVKFAVWITRHESSV